MESTPRRRWFCFAFSLRTLFVFVTIFGIWLGWQLSIVRERKAILAEIELVAPGKFLSVTLEKAESVRRPGTYADREYVRISRLRRILGDESYWAMFLPDSIDAELIKRVESAFPEAEISTQDAHRDSLYSPDRQPNTGTVFKTGLIEK